MSSAATSSAATATCPDSDFTDGSHDVSRTVSELVAQPSSVVLDVLGGLYEHSPWVAEEFLKEDENTIRSISTVTDLAARLKSIVNEASDEQKLALLRAHPDLCEKVEAMKKLTKESQEEQSTSGLQSIKGEELEKFKGMNESYKNKFGFPFILAVRNASKNTVLSALEGRLKNSSPQREFNVALEQVHNIAWMRLLTKVNTAEAKGFLTCHVLDTANGIPAEKMKIVLTRLTPEELKGVVGEFITNDDGRLEGGPALKGTNFLVGTYQWDFHAGDYFASKGQSMNGTPFLDVIPIRFGIDNPDDHYHVPLLVSPW
eukprot:CAMPEP_0201126258 /NCGR_PEP_ID=MMETSP0850-20130426/25383_1 /ASSEMBLY_ACC=CAM_ASM_000622 /TAXON_ID=183588 /ORGANISM="Pseudo-nitzschia fraudulenta, Strain WWA7" /LENGTH=315 /DNA_ID=CAMNT_0047394631 /DNA_START=139 /DNA_END=1083 /DNA_ORIENTATION=+